MAQPNRILPRVSSLIGSATEYLAVEAVDDQVLHIQRAGVAAAGGVLFTLNFSQGDGAALITPPLPTHVLRLFAQAMHDAAEYGFAIETCAKEAE